MAETSAITGTGVQNMEFSREKIRQIRNLMLFAAVLALAVIYSEKVMWGTAFVFGILRPFIYGGGVAFVLNIPMKLIEEKLLGRWKNKVARRWKRPLSMVLSIALIVLVLAVVVGMVLPQMAMTAAEVGRKIPVFMEQMMLRFEQLAADEPVLSDWVGKLESMEINWESILDNVVYFLKNGAGNVLNSTFNVAGSIISGVVNGAIALVFALYILAQKERLAGQGRRLISAYLPARAGDKIQEICSLLYRNFSNFITGQCLEAVILGAMFVIFMSIFRMPYAVVVGVLIAVMALIPIVGAFVGCGVGAFLIMINNPLQAVWFVVLFLVLQQIEGNLIYPRVVGNSVGLPSIWVLMAVSIGGSLFGIAGMLLFIPLMSTGYAVLRESVNKRNALKAQNREKGKEEADKANPEEGKPSKDKSEEGKPSKDKPEED